MQKFRTAKKWLTAYALACGYVETAAKGNTTLKLWHEGGPCFHVRAHDHDERGRIFWDTFPSLTEARKRFNKARRELGLTRIIPKS